VASTHSGPKAAPAAPGNGSPFSKTRSISFASLRLDEEVPHDLSNDLPPVAATPAMDEVCRAEQEVRRAEEAPEESALGVFSAWELRDMLAPAHPPPPSASPLVATPAKSRNEMMAMIQEAAEAARLAQGTEAQAAEAQDPADPAATSPLDLPPPAPYGASPSRRDAACRLLRSLLWAERPREPATAMATASSLV